MTTSSKPHCQVRRLESRRTAQLNRFLTLYARCFNPDERVSPDILRRVIQMPGRAVYPLHLFAAYDGREMIGGAAATVLPAFRAAFGSYIFVDPKRRGQGLGAHILRGVLALERRAPEQPWRLYGEVTESAGTWWEKTLRREGFRFFSQPWPIPSYHQPEKLLSARLCYYPLRSRPPFRFSQSAMLACIYTLFYGPDAMHRYLLPRLGSFVSLTP